jgi:hypothetical protein
VWNPLSLVSGAPLAEAMRQDRPVLRPHSVARSVGVRSEVDLAQAIEKLP